MAVYTVTDPDSGKTIKLQGDSPPTEQELEEIFSTLQQPEPFITSAQQPFEGVSGPESTGTLEAAKTIGSGIAGTVLGGISQGSLFPSGPKSVQERVETIEQTQEGLTVPPETESGRQKLQSFADTIQGINTVLSMPMAGLQGLATAISTGDEEAARVAMAEMLEQGVGKTLGENTFQSTEGMPAEARAGLATAAEVAPDVLLEATGAGAALRSSRVAVRVADRIRKAANKPDIDVFDDSGRFTDEAIAELEKLQPEQIESAVGEARDILTPDQARRLNLFRERGVTPLAADITRKTEDSIDQQQAIKEGGIVAEIAAGQEAQLTRLIREGITETGGIAVNADETSSSIRNAITNIAEDLDNKVTRAYQEAKRSAQGGKVVDLSDYIDFLKNNKGKDKVTDGAVSSALTDLKNRGLLGKDADPFVSVEDAELIRQGINKDFDPLKPRRNSFLREMKEMLDADVETAAGADIFADARRANIRFKQIVKRARRDKFDKTKGSLVEDILHNKLPEEKIFDKIVSAGTRADDIEKLRDFLLTTNNKQAWDDLRAQTLRNALDKALSTKNLREGGQATFNVRLFEKELQRIRGKKFDLLFNDDEKKLIQDIRDIGNARIPIAGTAQGEGPTSVAVKRALLARVPLVGEFAEGMVDAVTSRARDKRLTQFTDKTEEAIKRGQ